MCIVVVSTFQSTSDIANVYGVVQYLKSKIDIVNGYPKQNIFMAVL